MSVHTESISDTARAFFDACETGAGWAGCARYCRPGATFSSQAEPIAAMSTLAEYTDWMQGLLTFVPDGTAAVKSFATDPASDTVCIYGVFSGTHSAEGGPLPQGGKHTSSDYVYAIAFEDGKISHMTKIWNAGWAMRELGWIQ